MARMRNKRGDRIRVISHKTRHKTLAEFTNRRISVEGTVTKIGVAIDNGVRHRTMLLHDVFSTSPVRKRISDHIWVKIPSRFCIPARGDRVSFVARVLEYEKKYRGRDKSSNEDLGLFDLEDIQVIGSWND